jgi:hypothetical protein
MFETGVLHIPEVWRYGNVKHNSLRRKREHSSHKSTEGYQGNKSVLYQRTHKCNVTIQNAGQSSGLWCNCYPHFSTQKSGLTFGFRGGTLLVFLLFLGCRYCCRRFGGTCCLHGRIKRDRHSYMYVYILS